MAYILYRNIHYTWSIKYKLTLPSLDAVATKHPLTSIDKISSLWALILISWFASICVDFDLHNLKLPCLSPQHTNELPTPTHLTPFPWEINKGESRYRVEIYLISRHSCHYIFKKIYNAFILQIRKEGILRVDR
jgi:hypothetical protein